MPAARTTSTSGSKSSRSRAALTPGNVQSPATRVSSTVNSPSSSARISWRNRSAIGAVRGASPSVTTPRRTTVSCGLAGSGGESAVWALNGEPPTANA